MSSMLILPRVRSTQSNCVLESLITVTPLIRWSFLADKTCDMYQQCYDKLSPIHQKAKGKQFIVAMENAFNDLTEG